MVSSGISHFVLFPTFFLNLPLFQPCSACVSMTFESIAQFNSNTQLSSLYDETMEWQCRYFARIWKTRVFLHLSDRWQRECYDYLIEHLVRFELRLQLAHIVLHLSSYFSVVTMYSMYYSVVNDCK